MTQIDYMADAVRGVIQLLRAVPGCTYKRLREHCGHRGDDMSLWPAWTANESGYVTESGAAILIWEIMEKAKKKYEERPPTIENPPM